MAKDQFVRVRPDVLAADLEAYIALQGIANYKPSNPAYSLEQVTADYEALTASRKTTKLAEGALDTARDEEMADEWDIHNRMLGVKEQIIAQFGSDSNEAQLLGLKKKSEYARPSRKKDASTPSS